MEVLIDGFLYRLSHNVVTLDYITIFKNPSNLISTFNFNQLLKRKDSASSGYAISVVLGGLECFCLLITLYVLSC